jgi:hypothetical protein
LQKELGAIVAKHLSVSFEHAARRIDEQNGVHRWTRLGKLSLIGDGERRKYAHEYELKRELNQQARKGEGGSHERTFLNLQN